MLSMLVIKDSYFKQDWYKFPFNIWPVSFTLRQIESSSTFQISLEWNFVHNSIWIFELYFEMKIEIANKYLTWIEN